MFAQRDGHFPGEVNRSESCGFWGEPKRVVGRNSEYRSNSTISFSAFSIELVEGLCEAEEEDSLRCVWESYGGRGRGSARVTLQ
jgi:hypothetical protein